MDSKTKTAVAANADLSRPPATSESSAPSVLGALLDQACTACLRLAVGVFLAFGFVQTVRRARHDAWDLAFVVAAYADLALLFLYLRRAERLTPASPAGERRRLQLAVWALSAALSCAFAYRVCRIMPAALAVVVWCVTASVLAVGFYFLVVYDDRRSEDGCDVSHGKSFPMIQADEIV